MTKSHSANHVLSHCKYSLCLDFKQGVLENPLNAEVQGLDHSTGLSS